MRPSIPARPKARRRVGKPTRNCASIFARSTRRSWIARRSSASDASAFTRFAGSGGPATWRSDAGAMRVDADPQPAPAQYAVFGDSDWRHVQIETTVDPAGGEAGVAVAVVRGAIGRGAAVVGGRLRMIERDGAHDPAARRSGRGDARRVAGSARGHRLRRSRPRDDRRAEDRRRRLAHSRGPARARLARRRALHAAARGRSRCVAFPLPHQPLRRFHGTHLRAGRRVRRPAPRRRRSSASLTVAELLTQTAAGVPQVDAGGRATPRSGSGCSRPGRQRSGCRSARVRAILTLTRWVENDATPLFLLESDEPLPFSGDVTVTLAKRIKVPTFPHPTPPPIVGTAAAIPDLELDDARIVAPTLPARARAARRILRVIAVERGRVEVEAFEIDRSRRESLLANRPPQEPSGRANWVCLDAWEISRWSTIGTFQSSRSFRHLDTSSGRRSRR